MPVLYPRITITQVSEVTEELYQACHRLVPQISSTHPLPTRHDLELMLLGRASSLFIARHEDFGDEIIGMATLVVYRVPTGLRGYIEDVVVDEKARRRGVGEALTRICLDQAKEAGCTQVMLTSNPSRIAANQLYQRMGFKLRKTNVYRYSLKSS